MTEGPLLWYLNRGTGFTTLALLTLATVLGVLTSRTKAGGLVPGFVFQSVHRAAGLLAVTMLVVHVATAVADQYVDIRWWQAFVPLDLAYRPVWLALGTVALDLLVAVLVATWLRIRLGAHRWRRIHLLSYAVWGFGVAHGLGIGTDTGAHWARWLYVTSATLVGLAVLVRLATGAVRPVRRRVDSPVAEVRS
jgi:DMSO/TMAO reductase YedYZ heme-binding membrane subunit